MASSFCGSPRRALRTAVFEGTAREPRIQLSPKLGGAFTSLGRLVPSRPWCQDNSVEGAGKFARPHALGSGGRYEDHLAARSIGVQRRPGAARSGAQIDGCRTLSHFGSVGPAKALRQISDVDDAL